MGACFQEGRSLNWYKKKWKEKTPGLMVELG